jgi:hypothetical protein
MTRVILLAACLAACAPRGGARTPGPDRDSAEWACEPRAKQSESKDGGASGRMDTFILREGGRVTCRHVDTNGDGRADLEQAFDGQGRPLRERFDLDYDGRFDRTDFFSNGQLVRRELDTNADGKIDIWELFDQGTLSRLEQDQDDDGKVDYWEFWERGVLVRIGFDPFGTGKPERVEQVRR